MNGIDIEVQILSGMCLEPANLEYMDDIQAEYFANETHRIIFEAIREVFKAGKIVDMVTVYEAIKKAGKHIDIAYMTDTFTKAISLNNMQEYISILQKRYSANQIRNIGHKLVSEPENEAVLDEVEQRIYDLKTCKSKKQTTIKDSVMLAVENIEKKFHSDKMEGLDTGFEKLNQALNGLCPGYHILAARPGMGKTSLALEITARASIHEKKKVAVFSLEMGGERLVERILYQKAMVSANAIKKKTATADDFSDIHKAAAVLYESDIEVFDNLYYIEDIKTECLRLKRTQGLDLVIIDYLTLVKSRKRHESRRHEVEYISSMMIPMWKQLGCPVVMLSQLSRTCEQRNDKRPMLSDLRESGSIEQDADSVMFIYRDEYYNPGQNEGEAEIIIGKNRYGETGIVKVGFIAEMTKFIEIKQLSKGA